jgi:hypothetical protein
MREEIDIEKLVLEKAEYVEGAIDKWFEKIPEEELDKPVIAVFGKEIEPITYTPRALYEEVKKEIKETKKISKEKKGFIKDVVKTYGGK